MSQGAVAAVDIGAASGRVVVGQVGPGILRSEEVHRFGNDPVALPDGLYWDALRLHHETVQGLRNAARVAGAIRSIGIDTWGVDYGLLGDAGDLLGNPVHYRDPRHQRGMARVHDIIEPTTLYGRNGLQILPFNTLYQLVVARESAAFAAARTMLLMPDLLSQWLTGVVAAERTNASTTGLLDAHAHVWATDLIVDLGLPVSLFPALSSPGDQLGGLLSSVAREIGAAHVPVVTAVGSHDTASAVLAIPADGEHFAYVSCGTWALVGVELETPVLSESSQVANFTNEAGVDGRVRFLRNVMGLWLLQETMRTWELSGSPEDLRVLLPAAASLRPGGPVIDPDDPAFLPQGDMQTRIEAACDRAGQPRPASRPAFVRCILDSLALAFARTLEAAARLSGRRVDVVHIVGGGSRNELLCQLTADACERPVIAGPAEATALGNILVQARSVGLATGTIESLRSLVRSTHALRRFEPRTRPAR